jgi:hypothetical protein
MAAPFLALYVFVLGKLRAIFRSLRDGSPFVDANARRLRHIGLALLVAEGLHVFVTSVVVGPALERPRPVRDGERIQARTGPTWEVVFLAPAVLVLAEVFRRGTEMQVERELTV